MLTKYREFCRINKKKGQVLVETALIIPVLLVFLLGIIDLSRAWLLKNNLNEVAREGGRFAVMLPDLSSNDSRVRKFCEDILEEQGLVSDSDIAIEIENEPPSIGDPITVRVSKRFQGISGSLIPYFKKRVRIQSSVVMRFIAS